MLQLWRRRGLSSYGKGLDPESKATLEMHPILLVQQKTCRRAKGLKKFEWSQYGHHIFDTQPLKIPLHIFPPSFTVEATITNKQVLGNLLHGGSSGITTQISTLHHSSLDHIMQSLNHGIPSSLQMASSNNQRCNHLSLNASIVWPCCLLLIVSFHRSLFWFLGGTNWTAWSQI